MFNLTYAGLDLGAHLIAIHFTDYIVIIVVFQIVGEMADSKRIKYDRLESIFGRLQESSLFGAWKQALGLFLYGNQKSGQLVFLFTVITSLRHCGDNATNIYTVFQMQKLRGA